MLVTTWVVAMMAAGVKANSLDPWIALENSHLPPHELIVESESLLAQHQQQGYLAGEVRGNVMLALAHLSLEQDQQAQSYLDRAKRLNESANSVADRLKINNLQASVYAMNGDIKQAVEAVIANLAQARALDDPILLGDTLIQYAYTMQLESQYAEAIERLFEAQQLFEKTNDHSRLMTIQSNLAIIYSKLKNYHKAIEYYRHAVEFAIELGDDFSLSIFYYNLGTAHIGLENWPSAIDYFSQAKDLSVALDDKAGVALATSQLGSVMIKNQQFTAALPLLLDANDMLTDAGSEYMRMRIKLDIAMIYAKQGQVDFAKAYISEVEWMMAQGGDDSRFPRLSLGEVYSELGLYQDSSRIFYAYIDQLNKDFEIKKQLSLQRLEVIYDVRFEKSRNELLEKENELNESELARQNQFRMILALSLILVLVFLALTFRQIRIQRAHKQKFKALAYKDELTQAANRRGILAFAQESLEQLVDTHDQLVLAIIDLDHFKQVNDRFGHDVGDQVLIYFAKIVGGSLRSHEKVGRYGGEEWLLVLPQATPDEIQPLFNKLLKAYQQHKPANLPAELVLNFSMGAVVAQCGQNESINALLKQADEALYQAKQNGRARCEVAQQGA
ncbi:tetratricopeptide repeat-containing diguanylate cyclase [Motilimonas eburnea]|uniref:tetratricopeptide repeat-containing diguanylate cyclase n=1 Tax=Motilimonas eburnea TaxID=1737488 RepID=UPI001E6249DF|nr:tetratricopeptide repeat-containing diguanylate cyclase [Motilimonas eburnea]MCE2573499.1 GGDEF domain-containing protein [Motilimonas eburnea]